MLELIAATTIVGLAAWRVAAMLAYEKGPGRVFKRLRSALGVTHAPDGEEQPIDVASSGWRKPIAEGLICPWCLGIWVAGGMTALWLLVSPWPLVPLAASAILLLVERAMEKTV